MEKGEGGKGTERETGSEKKGERGCNADENRFGEK